LTYELLGLAPVFDLDDGFPTFVDDLEREVLEIRLDLCIAEFTADHAFGIKNADPLSETGWGWEEADCTYVL
jgi:hypothetical protein